MRLIDADAFLQNLINCDIGRKGLEKVIEVVKEQQTAYDLDKVVEKLEEERENVGFVKATTEVSAYIRGINDAIKIVKGGGVDGN